MTQSAVTLANLKLKLESEGVQVPQYLEDVLATEGAIADRRRWRDIIHAEWRDRARLGRADQAEREYDEYRLEHDRKKLEEIKRRGLPAEIGKHPYDIAIEAARNGKRIKEPKSSSD